MNVTMCDLCMTTCAGGNTLLITEVRTPDKDTLDPEDIKDLCAACVKKLYKFFDEVKCVSKLRHPDP